TRVAIARDARAYREAMSCPDRGVDGGQARKLARTRERFRDQRNLIGARTAGHRAEDPNQLAPPNALRARLDERFRRDADPVGGTPDHRRAVFATFATHPRDDGPAPCADPRPAWNPMEREFAVGARACRADPKRILRAVEREVDLTAAELDHRPAPSLQRQRLAERHRARACAQS